MKTEFEYINRMTEILQEVYEVNKDNIKIAAEKFAETMLNDRIIHTFGTVIPTWSAWKPLPVPAV